MTKRKKVLLVSANHDFKEGVHRALAGSGYEITNTPDIDMALIALNETNQDVILVDHNKSFFGEDIMHTLYTYGGSIVEGKPILLFTDYHRPTNSIRNRPVDVLANSLINREDLIRIIEEKLH